MAELRLLLIILLLLAGCADRCQDGKTICGGAYSPLYLGDLFDG